MSLSWFVDLSVCPSVGPSARFLLFLSFYVNDNKNIQLTYTNSLRNQRTPSILLLLLLLLLLFLYPWE